MDGGCLNLVARTIAVDPSQRSQLCCLALVYDSLVLSWVVSVWWVNMLGNLVVGCPRPGCDRFFPLAKVEVMSSEVGHCSRCGEDVVCAVDVFACACA